MNQNYSKAQHARLSLSTIVLDNPSKLLVAVREYIESRDNYENFFFTHDENFSSGISDTLR